MSGPPPPPEQLLEGMRKVINDPETEEAISMVFFGNPMGPNAIVPVEEHPQVTLRMMAVSVMIGKMPKPDWIAVVSDTYCYSGEDRPEGSLADAFKAGDPMVTEGIVAMCRAPDGPSYCAMQSYVRLPSGEIEWRSVKDRTDIGELGGVLPDLMDVILATTPLSTPDKESVWTHQPDA